MCAVCSLLLAFCICDCGSWSVSLRYRYRYTAQPDTTVSATATANGRWNMAVLFSIHFIGLVASVSVSVFIVSSFYFLVFIFYIFTWCYMRESIGETLDDRYSFERRVC